MPSPGAQLGATWLVAIHMDEDLAIGHIAFSLPHALHVNPQRGKELKIKELVEAPETTSRDNLTTPIFFLTSVSEIGIIVSLEGIMVS